MNDDRRLVKTLMSVKEEFFLYLGYIIGKGFFSRMTIDYDAQLHHPDHRNDSWDIYLHIPYKDRFVEKDKVYAQFSDSLGWIPYSGPVNSLEHLEELIEEFYWLKKKVWT